MAYIATYCEKCGHTGFSFSNKIETDTCFICRTQGLLKPIPDKYLDYAGTALNSELEKEFMEEVVKKSPNFNQESYDRGEIAIADRKRQDSMPKISSTGKSNSVTCPYCKSTNVSKISTLGRSVSVGLFGLGSSKIGKQWHCNGCKSDF